MVLIDPLQLAQNLNSVTTLRELNLALPGPGDLGAKVSAFVKWPGVLAYKPFSKDLSLGPVSSHLPKVPMECSWFCKRESQTTSD